MDNCGNAVADGVVVASFDNNDPPLTLLHRGNGIYSHPWQSLNPANQITVTVTAARPPLAEAKLPPVQVQVPGFLTAATPILFSGGIVECGQFRSPGACSAGENHSPPPPLRTTLGGATLNVAGREAPLFFSSAGQVNAQVPFELPANLRSQAFVKVQRAPRGRPSSP